MVAAVSYHVDEDASIPLQLMSVVLRDDDPDVFAQSCLCAWYLTQYLQAIAKEIGRGAWVDFVDEYLNFEPELSLLGFEELPAATYKAKGRVYRQLPT